MSQAFYKEGATTIESTLLVEASRVHSSEWKRRATYKVDDIV